MLISLEKDSPHIAPLGTHTNLAAQTQFAADIKTKLDAEFKPLANLGNSCYVNAIMQCFVHTPLLRSYLTTGVYRTHIDPTLRGDLMSNAVADFAVSYFKFSDVRPALRRLKVAVGKILPQFKASIQHDAQEVEFHWFPS